MHSRRSILGAATATSVLSIARLPRASAQGDTTTERGVIYGMVDGENLFADVYRPVAREAARPAIVLIHAGGWWSGGVRTDLDWAASELAAAGYVCFTIDYRLFDAELGRNAWPAQLDDAQRAVRWIRANAAAYNVDPDRIAALGHSAGGQLAALLALRDTRDNSDGTLAGFSSRVACVVDHAGNNDLSIPDPNPNYADFLALFLGGSSDAVPDAYLDASPIAWLTEAPAPPFLLVSGGKDTEQPLEQTWHMAAALLSKGGEVTCAHFPEADHYAVKDWSVSGAITLAFLGQHFSPAV